MNLSKSQLIIVSIFAVVVLAIIGIFTGLIPGTRRDTTKPPQIELTVWGVENEDSLSPLFRSYESLNSNIQIDYTEFDPSTYEEDLINALAANRGPDVFMIHNTWLPKHYEKLVAAADSKITLEQFRSLFPTVAEQDFAPDNVIYALPLYIDTLALYYNQDVFDSEGVALLPTSWGEFQNLIPKLRQIDKDGNITRAGTALGGSLESMNTATDILNLLMLQNGTTMVNNEFTQATFANRSNNFPALEALNFYTKFSDPESLYYTWSDNLNALDDFSRGKVATIFDYESQKEIIKNKNPFLNFRILPMPQIDPASKKISFASYWGFGVSNKSAYPDWAWDLIINLTTNEGQSSKYLNASGRPAALKSLIDISLSDLDLGVFARQALTARSWPQIDSKKIADIFSKMIQVVNEKKLDADTAIDQAERGVTDLMRARR